MATNNKDVPTETLLRHVVKERDHYKAKLERLVPYTKSLEEKVRVKDSRIEALKKEVASAAREVTRSSIYKGLFESYKKVKRDNQTLLSQIAILRNQKQ